MNFSNEFFQDTLVEDVYILLPYNFDSETGEDRSNMVTKLNKSLYGLVQDSLYYQNNLKVDFEEIGYKPIPLYPWMFYGRGMISLIYVDDVIFFGTDQYKIGEVIK